VLIPLGVVAHIAEADAGQFSDDHVRSNLGTL
jgi:hypothetical protein